MNNLKNKIELLSPAKNTETGIAAINCGADAVYIGAFNFSARKAASNSLADIETLVMYAHKYRAKVYVTINTILYDDELAEVRKMIFRLFEMGVDAIIIQDFGILEMDLPPIPIHASTQMNNRSVEHIQFLEKTGFSRVILARELSLQQIANIHQNTNIELECFVHGALCVCYSGRCYMSQTIGGRSANRGECAQACRLPYNLLDARGNMLLKDKYLLSLKDLNLSSNIDDMIEAGVSSFKIEGRLKDIAYVKNVTGYYRNVIDEFLSRNSNYCKASQGNVNLGFEPNLYYSFNRGFTDYFTQTRRDSVVSLNTPKSVGQFIGTVEHVGRGFIKIDTKQILTNGDGLCFFDANDQLQGLKADKIDGSDIFFSSNETVPLGVAIYRNYNHAFTKLLDNARTNRTLPVDMLLFEAENSIKLRATDTENNSATVVVACEKEISQKGQQIFDVYRKQLSKTGDTIFEANDIQIQFSNNWFIPISIINEARRQVLILLESVRQQTYSTAKGSIKKDLIEYPISMVDFTTNIANRKARDFFEKRAVTVTENAIEIAPRRGETTVMTTKYCIRHELNMCLKKTDKSKKQPATPLYIENKFGRFRLLFNCDECEMQIVKE